MAGIDGIGIENWRNKPIKEIVNNMEVVEEEDSEVATWAQAMAAVAEAPDNVTYDMAGGSAEQFTQELEAVTANGLQAGEKTEAGAPEDVDVVGEAEEVPEEEAEEAVEEEETAPEEPDEEEKAEAAAGEVEDPNAPPKDVVESETAEETEDGVKTTDEVNTDDEELRKRKQKKGEEPAQ